jgi:hypothetical protein
MKKFALAVACIVALAALATAEEFNAQIIEINGKKVGYFKSKDFGPGDSYYFNSKSGMFTSGKKRQLEGRNWWMTEVATDVRIAKGTYDKKEDRYIVGELIEGGLDAEFFKQIMFYNGIAKADKFKTIGAHITVADDAKNKGKITQILIYSGPRPKKMTDVP